MNNILLFMPSGGELVIIAIVIVMLFGSKKIPELARGLGKGMREIKNATGDIQREIREGAREMNAVKDEVNIDKQVKDLIKEDKEKKDAEPEENMKHVEDDEIEDNNQESKSQTIHRRKPNTSEKPKNPTDNA